MKQNTYKPVRIFHPGVTLREKISELGMSIKEFALRASKPEKTINAVLNGSSSITPEMAIAFEQVTRIPAHMWLSLQSVFDESRARKKREQAFEDPAALEWGDCFPYELLAELHWLPEAASGPERVENLFDFFGITSIHAWEGLYLHQELKIAFSISLKEANNPYALSAWLRRGEILAQQMEMEGHYDVGALKERVPQMVALSRKPDEGHAGLCALCAKSGIRLVFLPHIPNAPVNGCVRWIGDTPCILLPESDKADRHFWFTFFHELGHIVLHGKKNIFLEDDSMWKDQVKEAEADSFAEAILISAQFAGK